MSGWDLVVFSGPSLPPDEARKLARGKWLPPAKQGDVYRVLARRPKAIALIDGLFESVPSVWHREIVAALDAGVAVFGSSSMGALRAAELASFGMVGIGQVFQWVVDGTLRDDAQVALLHADAEHGYRALTVPLVTVWHTAKQARSARKLTRSEVDRLIAAAEAMHYQQRTWPAILEATALTPEKSEAFRVWLRSGAEDIKRLDAIACVEAARAFVESGACPPVRPLDPVPSHARHRQLEQSVSISGDHEVAGRDVLDALCAHPRFAPMAEAGVKTLALAALARSLQVRIPERELAAQLELLRGGLKNPAELGLDEGQLRRLAETRCLERYVLDNSRTLFPDGPSPLEGLALEARLSGVWREVVRKQSKAKRSRGS